MLSRKGKAAMKNVLELSADEQSEKGSYEALPMPSSYTVQLSANLDRYSSVSMEVTLAEIEPHGAIVLSRFISGEETEQFELSGAEFNVLLATVKRRQRLLARAREAAFSELDLPF